jgi:hypothetical protein
MDCVFNAVVPAVVEPPQGVVITGMEWLLHNYPPVQMIAIREEIITWSIILPGTNGIGHEKDS